jgi:chromosome segregation ATPase
LDDELRSLREQEPQHLERKNELDALRRQLDTEFTTLQREENNVRQRTRPIVTDINRCDRELEELTNMADHSGLEDQVANERTICERARTRLNEIVEQKRAAQSSVDDGPRRQREALSARMQALQSSTQEAVRMLERFATQTNAARREVATVAESVASHRQRVDTLKAELAQKKALVTTLEVQVNDFGGFYVADPPREERVVNRELQNAERQKRSAQLQLNAPSAESVMREYLAAQHRYDEDRTALDMYMQTLESLRTSVSARQRKWYQLRESFSSTLSMNFNNHLGRREHAGSLRLDHDRETMEVVVHLDGRQHQPGSSSSAAAGGGDTAGLSGGEKSFTQLCLLLAMWSSCEAPFHAADEFDVFMDNVYRKVGIDMLLDAARNVFPSRQFILVTPLDVTQIKPDPIIKKHFLKPPRQDGQASMLDFAQPVAQQE